jgi:hypothetical protein
MRSPAPTKIARQMSASPPCVAVTVWIPSRRRETRGLAAPSAPGQRRPGASASTAGSCWRFLAPGATHGRKATMGHTRPSAAVTHVPGVGCRPAPRALPPRRLHGMGWPGPLHEVAGILQDLPVRTPTVAADMGEPGQGVRPGQEWDRDAVAARARGRRARRRRDPEASVMTWSGEHKQWIMSGNYRDDQMQRAW